MPGPFPGMDPYLEAPGFWPGVQFCLVVYIMRVLNVRLPPNFAADIGKRVYLQKEGECDALPERERFVEVVTTGNKKRVVAAIEVLSPANKMPGTGHREYVSKQQAILQSQTHLLEIDLLRSGSHTVALPERAVREQAGTWDYLFSLHRGGEAEHYQYWSKTVRDPLPRSVTHCRANCWFRSPKACRTRFLIYRPLLARLMIPGRMPGR